MINITDKKNCCGCTACYSVCPRNAIRMTADEEGFKYPEVDSSLCTNCGLCDKACAFSKDFPEKLEIGDKHDTLACHSKNDETHKTSRSGGVFFELSKQILSENGVVYGVALSENFEAVNIAVETEKDLPKLQKSKYVQSNKGDIYKAAAESIKSGRKVFFSGTGCEIAGLRMYLKTRNISEENLITCDIICHGAPSPLIWKENIEDISKKYGQDIKSVEFRDKVFGWPAHIESYTLADGKTKYSNKFTTFFYSHNIIRPSCNNCHFCTTKRTGDITIADCWGFGAVHPEVSANKGMSFVMLNTEKGRALYNQVKDNLEVYEMPIQTPEAQPNLYRPSTTNPDRAKFWETHKAKGYKGISGSFYPLVNRAGLAYNMFKKAIKR